MLFFCNVQEGVGKTQNHRCFFTMAMLINLWGLGFLWLPPILSKPSLRPESVFCNITLFPPILINPIPKVLAMSGDTELLNISQQNFQILVLRYLISFLRKIFPHCEDPHVSPLPSPAAPLEFTLFSYAIFYLASPFNKTKLSVADWPHSLALRKAVLELSVLMGWKQEEKFLALLSPNNLSEKPLKKKQTFWR